MLCNIIIEENTTTLRTNREERLTNKETAHLLKLHSRFIGFICAFLDKTDPKDIGSLLVHIYLSIMAGGGVPIDCKVSSSLSMMYDLEKDTASPVFDESLPEDFFKGLIGIFGMLSRMLQGDIDYVFFSSEIQKSFNEGLEEGKKEKGK